MRCPTCGSVIDSGALSCKYCGRNLSNDIRLAERQRQIDALRQQNAEKTVSEQLKNPYGQQAYREPQRKNHNGRRTPAINYGMWILIGLTLLTGIFVLHIIEIIILLVK